MLLPDIAKRILSALMEAEDQNQPMTLDDSLSRWGNGSTWEDLVDGGYVCRMPQAVTVTKLGKQWLEKHSP